MASWTTPVTHVSGDVLSVSDWNGVANNETFLYQAPYAAVFNSLTTSCGAGGATQVTLGGTAALGYGWTVSSNNLVVPLTGVYYTAFSVTTGTAGSGVDEIQSNMFFSGTQVLDGSTVPSYVANPSSSGSGIVSAGSSATFGLWLTNLSGSTLSTTPASYATYLHSFFVGSQ